MIILIFSTFVIGIIVGILATWYSLHLRFDVPLSEDIWPLLRIRKINGKIDNSKGNALGRLIESKVTRMEQQHGTWFPFTLVKSSIEESRAIGNSNCASFFLGRASGIADMLDYFLGGNDNDFLHEVSPSDLG